MNEEIRKLIGSRLKQERERLGWSQARLADISFVSKRSVAAWESGETAPGGDALAIMSISSVDVLFVVTGMRGTDESTLAPAERALLASYSRADEAGRAALDAVAVIAARESSSVAQGKHTVHVGGSVHQQVVGDQTVSGGMNFNIGGKRK